MPTDARTMLAPAAAHLDRTLASRPALGAFSLAGFPDEKGGIDALTAYAREGANVLEVGAPASNPYLDGPVIDAAHRHAVRRGHGMDSVLTTVQELTLATGKPVVVMAYWASVLAYGPKHLAHALATVGGAGCLVPDVPLDRVGAWEGAAADAGIHAPLLAGRQVPVAELTAICRAASGFIYAPAVAGHRTGYRDGLDMDGLSAFVASVRQAAPTSPVVTGIGVSTPQRAADVVRQADVSGVVIGSPLVRALLSDGSGLSQSADLVGKFAAAIAQQAER
ncbi:tryptophan synthase subunit alpha [Streptomyces decoyicus]|uniref:tryptophan synthase subunit alpha n=1 Tax=Streptomyces decoyicus TaxID=249567 RepID=UPI003866E5B4